MKTVRVLSLLLLVSASLVERAARADGEACSAPPNALIADLGMHVVNAGYQRTLGCMLSLQLTAGLYGPWTVDNDVLGLGGGHRTATNVGFIVRGRAFVHPLGTAPTGFWISPFVQGGPVVDTDAGSKLAGRALAGGISAGWAFGLGESWLLALGAGAQYHTVSYDSSTAPPGFALFGPTLDVNVGFRF